MSVIHETTHVTRAYVDVQADPRDNVAERLHAGAALLCDAADPNKTYGINLQCHHHAEGPRRSRTSAACAGSDLSTRLAESINGHPEGYPKGPWAFALDVTDAVAFVRITITEVQGF